MENKIKVSVLRCGDVLLDESFIDRSKTNNPVAFAGLFRSQKHQIIVPATAYLIEHPKGKILIDTALNKTIRDSSLKELTFIHNMTNRGFQAEGQAIDEILDSKGIKPQDLDYVILSHLHTDHVSGLKLVKDAKNIIVSEEELKHAQRDKIKYVQRMWEGVNLKTFHMEPSQYGPMNRSFDLFGDDSVILVHIPGHTKGLTGVLIQNNGKFILLAADCGYSTKSWEQGIIPAIMSSREDMTKSLKWVKEMASKENCVVALANHDPCLPATVFEI